MNIIAQVFKRDKGVLSIIVDGQIHLQVDLEELYCIYTRKKTDFRFIELRFKDGKKDMRLTYANFDLWEKVIITLGAYCTSIISMPESTPFEDLAKK